MCYRYKLSSGGRTDVMPGAMNGTERLRLSAHTPVASCLLWRHADQLRAPQPAAGLAQLTDCTARLVPYVMDRPPFKFLRKPKSE